MKNFWLDIRDKVLLFDFDGTLVETEKVAIQVIREYFREKNPEFRVTPEVIIGRTWQAAVVSMKELALKDGVELESASDLLHHLRTRYREALETGAKLIPGFLECLPFLKAQARFMGIVTGSDREDVDLILKSHKLDQSFDQIWAFGDYEKSKPDPSPYQTALQALNIKASDAIVFEDSVAGMESAHLAGLSFVQIAYEGHAKVVDPRAIKVVKDWGGKV